VKRFALVFGMLIVVVIIGATAWLLRGHPSPPTATDAASNAAVTVLKGATVIDGTGKAPIANAVVVIRGTRVAAVGPASTVQIPAEAKVIDVSGKFLIPGLADMHNHLRSGMSSQWENPRPNLARLLAWGFTMTFTPAMEKDAFVWLKTRITTDDAGPYAHFWGTGPMIIANETPGADFSPRSAEEARSAVRTLKASNVDAVKLFYDDMSWLMQPPRPMLSPEIMTATIEEAHKQALKVYVHAPVLKYAKAVLQAGADGLLHGVMSDPVDDEFVALMKKNHAVYVSTLSLFESASDLGTWAQREAAFDERGYIAPDGYARLQSPTVLDGARSQWTNQAFTKDHLPVARQNLKKLFDAGIPVVAGTDTGILGVVVGVSSHLELVLLSEAGLSPTEVLRVATVNAARMVGREKDLGTIETGKLADILILDADPLANISNTRKVHRVVKGGVVYDPAELFREADLPDDQMRQQIGR
jgi:imidazolonepropionase-like amidohydrolase